MKIKKGTVQITKQGKNIENFYALINTEDKYRGRIINSIGELKEVTDSEIVIELNVDIPRLFRFDRVNGICPISKRRISLSELERINHTF